MKSNYSKLSSYSKKVKKPHKEVKQSIRYNTNPNKKNLSNIPEVEEERDIESPYKNRFFSTRDLSEENLDYDKVASLFFYVKFMTRVFSAWRFIYSSNIVKFDEKGTNTELVEISSPNKISQVNRISQVNIIPKSDNKTPTKMSVIKLKSICEKIYLKNAYDFIIQLKVLKIDNVFKESNWEDSIHLKQSNNIEINDNFIRSGTISMNSIIKPFLRVIKETLSRIIVTNSKTSKIYIYKENTEQNYLLKITSETQEMKEEIKEYSNKVMSLYDLFIILDLQ